MELHLVGWGEARVPGKGAWDKWPADLGKRWPNFSPWEFRSRDGSNMIVLDMDLLDGLQELRRLVTRPITVNSGYRTIEHNRKVGGSPYSQHLMGKAADIVIAGFSVERMNTAAQRIPMFARGGIGVYPGNGFVHVDVRGVKTRWRQ